MYIYIYKNIIVLGYNNNKNNNIIITLLINI